ncbi:TolC family protein [candidate division KSB1 bacterium]|nr:TolC family protein [candidate division KSB1 bacterium]
MRLNKQILSLFVILVLLVPLTALSQEILVLDLERSIDLALKNNPSIKMAEKEVSKARAGVWEAVSNILPQLDASANFQKAWEIQEQVIPNFIKMMLPPGTPGLDQYPDYVQIAFGIENTFRYGATVTQPLFLGGAGIAGIQLASAAKDAAEQNLEDQRQNLIYDAANAFYLCLLSKELVAVQDEAMTQAKANFDNVAKKYNVGMASGFDKMRAEVEVANLQPELITAKNNYQSALTQLKVILGMKRDGVIDVEGKFEYQEDEFGNMVLHDLQTIALKDRPIIRALGEQKYITQKGVALARSSFLPKLFFQTDYSYMAMRNDYKFTQDDFSKGFTSAVSLQIPLFHGFRSSAQYQKARLDYRKMLDTEKQVFDGISAETEFSYNKFQEAKQKYLSARQTVDLATEALRLANMMYQEGVNTQLDVLSSQLALTRAKLFYVNSLYEYQTSRYQLRRVTGKLSGIL